MGAVPERNDEMRSKVLPVFKNLTIAYPGTETIYKGRFSEEMRELTLKMSHAKSPYTAKYMKEHPKIMGYYEQAEEKLYAFVKDKYDIDLLNDMEDTQEMENEPEL